MTADTIFLFGCLIGLLVGFTIAKALGTYQIYSGPHRKVDDHV